MNQVTERQKLSQDAIIEMLIIDVDGTMIYVTHERNAQDPPLAWSEIPLLVCDFKSEGFEARGDEESPRPTISMSIVDPVIRAQLHAANYGKGGLITRQKIYLRNLDGQEDEDPTQIFGREIYRISKAKRQYPEVEWELISVLETSSTEFPHITLNRSYCDFIYRKWNGSSYDAGTCPYADTPKFNISNEPTTNPSLDRCSKTITGCRARYGNNPVPFRGTLGLRR